MTAPNPPSVIAICGKGRIATSALAFAIHAAAALRLRTRVVAVPNTDDKGYDGWQPSLARAAGLLDVPVVPLASLEEEEGLLLVSLEYNKIIRTPRFRSPRLFNIHFSNLPKYRGVFTSIWPLLNGEREAGVTLHQVDPGIDTGAIVAQRLFPIPDGCTARMLYDRYMDEGYQLFVERFPALLHGMPALAPQNESLATYYSRTSVDLTRLEIDLSADAETVCRWVRAMHFPEYQLPTSGGRAVRAAVIVPGSLEHDSPYGRTVRTGDGKLVLLTWA